MKLITGITSDYKQRASILLDDGTTVYLNLVYVAQQTGWFLDILWDDRQINSLRLTTSPNLLLKWKNLFPFGLMLLTDNNQEPLNVTDFSTGVAKLYLLNAEDVATVSTAAFTP